MKRSHAFIILGVCVAVAVLAAWAIRLRGPGYNIPREHVASTRAAHRWLAAGGVVPISDRDAIVALIEGAEKVSNQDNYFQPTDEMKRSLAELMAMWLDLRARADAEGYAAWMQSRGYVYALRHPKGRDHHHMDDWSLGGSWRRYSGEEPPEDLNQIDPERFFRLAFVGTLEEQRGMMRGEKVARRMQIYFQEVDAYRYDTRPVGLNEWPEADYYEGYSVSGDRPHWMPPISYEETLDRDERALVAMIFLGTQSAQGDWAPMCVAWYYDPVGETWHIESATSSNTLRSRPVIER
ncbi:MAG: hypothetical protein KF684_11945 [Phycisphaeraceae bacterium]|nr:hypothetical protein [Phycisphaeraceae bacterium]